MGRRVSPDKLPVRVLALVAMLAMGPMAGASRAVVQDCANYSSEFVQMEQFADEPNQANTCNSLPCYRAAFGSTTHGSTLPPELRVAVTNLGSHQLGIGGHVRIFWFRAGAPTVPCNPDFMGNGCANLISICGIVSSEITKDHVDTFLSSGATCANRFTAGNTYSLSAYTCKGGGSCERRADSPGLDLGPVALGGLLSCEPPPPAGCGGDNSCSDCIGVSGPASGGVQASGGPVGIGAADDGPGAHLTYLGGGLGRPGFPGSAGPNPWRVALGRYWGADYFERIVQFPDSSRVFLLTRYGSFRDFSGLSAGFYTTVAPSDEYRRLEYVAGTGWILHHLDGTLQSFDTSGRWTGTVDRNGNATTPQYVSGQLVSVSFPDGRSEQFSYYTDPNAAIVNPGTAPITAYQYCNDSTAAASCLTNAIPRSYLVDRLRSITEVGIGGAMRTWGYDWYGDDLVRVSRPDGTAWRFQYRDGRYPGFMTEAVLRATDGSERIVAAYAYDAKARAVKTWKGDTVLDGSGRPAPGPAALEVWSLNFTSVDANDLPITTEVTDPLGKVTTYTFGRDSASRKARLEHLDGSCPACGLAPNTDLTYGDATNPLRPTVVIDGNSNRTDRTYDAFGMTTATIEAVGVAGKQRETDWTYHPTFHSLPTSMTRASTSGAGTRETIWSYDGANGNLLSMTITGTENAAAFSHQTSYFDYTIGGSVGTVDPPSYGTADQTGFTYDPTRGTLGLLLQTRTDPLVGAPWTFGYDPFNRRNLVGDPNEHETFTEFDLLNRVKKVRERFTAGVDDDVNDLITIYTYTPFGDLDTVTLPKGNRVHYGYDGDGRLTNIERQPLGGGNGDKTTRDPLNAVGQPLTEKVEHWDGAQYVKDAETSFVYASRCQVQKTIRAPGVSGIEATTEYDYDCNGNLTKVWDAEHPKASFPADRSQTYRFDELGRVDRLTEYWAPGPPDPVGTAVTEYGYDVQDHLASVTDANGNVTTYTTGDRDLLTREISPVTGSPTGTTTHTYNTHGVLETTTDPRGIVVTRTVDAADRVTLVDFPDDALNVSHTYGTGANPALFDRARLTRVTRGGHAITYGYDRFGRIVGDGLLGYDYDKNGNRTTITYPLEVVATYILDFADRDESLVVTGAGSPQTVASLGKYTGTGLLRSLRLGNNLDETRTYDLRQFPLTIQLPGRLDWTYTTDHVGNVLAVNDALPANEDRSYTYQPVQFFLRSATGPWAGPLTWKYDKVGSRLEQQRGAATDVYTYEGTTPKLDAIRDGSASGPILHDYQIGLGGYVETVSGGGNTVTLAWDDEGNLARASRSPAGSAASFLYDGRGFLATTSGRLLVDGFEVGDTACWSAQLGGTAPTAACPADPAVSPTYASEGRLLAKPAETSAQDLVFYFAGRPVAQLRTGAVPTWTYLTTDHLGTPVAGTNGAQASIWHGGFEPFGAEFTTPSASSAGVFLRLPGQWDDTYWSDATLGASLFYNVRRWYEPLTGRYVRADPLGASRYLTLGPSRDFGLGVSEVPSIESSMLVIARPLQAYGYAEGRPTELIDSLGLSPGTAIAQAGGACILADGPLPIGDVLGVPLVLIGGALMAADWWEDRATCDDCDRADLEARCAAHYDADIQECQRRHPIHDVRSRMACYGHAMVRFDLCMRKMPIPPLQP